ncbi:MAG: YncE family protein, partial [Candidatus Hydrogenedentes bacterium]|nr:YncE family protein [Candidatus Hydrogenedentota bacterium]
MNMFLITVCLCSGLGAAEWPGPVAGGYYLPNGWRITPVGTPIPIEDLVLNIVPAPDDKVLVAVNGGYNPHGLVVIDAARPEAVQRIIVPTAWSGLAWHPARDKLYVSGGNNNDAKGIRAPIYIFSYNNGRLSDAPVGQLMEDIEPAQIYWSGLVHHPSRSILFAANRTAGNVVVFDTDSGKLLQRIPTEVNPYDLVLSPDAKTLYCSNWASDSVSVIDTETYRVRATIGVG